MAGVGRTQRAEPGAMSVPPRCAGIREGSTRRAARVGADDRSECGRALQRRCSLWASRGAQ